MAARRAPPDIRFFPPIRIALRAVASGSPNCAGLRRRKNLGRHSNTVRQPRAAFFPYSRAGRSGIPMGTEAWPLDHDKNGSRRNVKARPWEGPLAAIRPRAGVFCLRVLVEEGRRVGGRALFVEERGKG